MLFLVFGCSGAGKTAALDGLRRERIPRLAVHDFDEIGVPAGADTAWRQRTTEAWVRRTLDLQADGRDVLLGGQVALGEVLAAPSASELDGVSACLLDCDDGTRLKRIQARGYLPGKLQDHLDWAEWMRRHARDPSWRQDVIRGAGVAEMRWERWAGWAEGDPRWRVRVIDTSSVSVEQVVAALNSWIEEERAALHDVDNLS
jgi:hypothetical protein